MKQSTFKPSAGKAEPSLKSSKPSKPYPGFPLFAHASGRWAKKIRGKTHYFGKWSDGWQAAEALYNEQREDLHAGRTPRVTRDGLRLHQLVNRYLDAKERQRETGELQGRTWRDYYDACQKLVAAVGRDRMVDDLVADDFGRFRLALSKAGLGPVAVGNVVRRTRGLFKWALDNGVIDHLPRYGTEFVRPSVRTMRLDKASRPDRLFADDEVRGMLQTAQPQLRAMILLGINAAMGNSDVSELPISALDLESGVLDYPRPKTGIGRRCILWPETVQALRDVMARRKEPADQADKEPVFITKYCRRYIRFQESRKPRTDGKILTSSIDGIALEFGKLLTELGIKRSGVRFYALRHTFRTVADEVADQRAIDLIMGHHREADIANVYRHGVSDQRLRAITDHVRAWIGDWTVDASQDEQGSVG